MFPGFGTIANVVAITVAGIAGTLVGNRMPERMRTSLLSASGVAVIFIGVVQGLVTALALLAGPLLTEAALANLGLVGSILIFCVGVNLVWLGKLKVLNMLPAIVIAPPLAYLPIAL